MHPRTWYLVNLNLQRILHKLCCGREAGIVPLLNFVKKLKEQERWMVCGRVAPMNMNDVSSGSIGNSPVKGAGYAQQLIDVESSDEEEEVPLTHFGSATNASTSTSTSVIDETISQSETITESEAMQI